MHVIKLGMTQLFSLFPINFLLTSINTFISEISLQNKLFNIHVLTEQCEKLINAKPLIRIFLRIKNDKFCLRSDRVQSLVLTPTRHVCDLACVSINWTHSSNNNLPDIMLMSTHRFCPVKNIYLLM